jgi:Replication initiation factor
VDYATAVFVSASPKHQQEVFDFCVSIGEDLSSSYSFQERGHSPHFSRVFSHDLGMRVELSELDTGEGRNKGMTVLTLPGSAFYLQDSDRQMLMLWKVTHQEGFKWFSRLDFQNTELQPEWDTDRVHQGVESGELWVKGYGRWRPYGELDADGSCPDGRTLYWGSTRAERQGRTYDKAKQSGWSQPAIRDELQLRGDWAHSFGRELRSALDSGFTSAEQNANVSTLVTSALNQHLQYWSLNGADPKSDKNWQRKAEPADWYQARIGKHSEPIRKAPRPALDLESSVTAGCRQYGRAFVLWVERMSLEHDLSRDFVLEALYGRFLARLRPEDVDEAFPWLEGDERAAWLAELEDLKDGHAIAAERGWWAAE